jgi:hypothetical protein
MPILAFKMPARVASRSRASTKGRGGRKGGPDRRSSGPERRRVLKPQNYSTTPAIKAWRPPVPEPLPPAPLLGPKELLGLGLLIGGQVWAWLNSRPKTSGFDPGPAQLSPILGTVPPPGNTVGASLRIVRSSGSAQYIQIQNTGNQPGQVDLSPLDQTITNVRQVDGVVFERLANGNHFAGLRYVRADNTIGRNGPQVGSDREFVTFTPQYTLTWNNPTAVPYENPEANYPLPDGYVVPQVDVSTSPAVAPAPLPLPAPSTVPQVEPEVQPAVAPVAPDTNTIPLPQVVRTTTTVTTQQKLPGAVTTQNGALPAATPSPVPTTDPGSIIPWPGAAPIPGNGPAPAPTLDGIAQEVGRIERKIEMMMSPSAPGNLVNQLGDLADLIGPIVGAILAAGSGTVYTLDSPCEVDEATGEKLPPVEVEAPGGLTQFGAVLNRIDALAQLIQVHKNLRQPNCKPKQPTGEFVTVNFEQID